jgi:hypothetical protein
MDLTYLREHYPLVAADFADSPYADGEPDALMGDLASYFRGKEHHVHMSNTPPGSKGSNKPIYYRAILKVHGTVLSGWTTTHTSYDSALAEGVVRFLEMFEQHLTMQMTDELLPPKRTT